MTTKPCMPLIALSPRFKSIGCLALLLYVTNPWMWCCAQSAAPRRPSAASTTASALAGLWGSEQMFGPTIRGQLTVDTRHSQWCAEIAGFLVPVEHTQKGITFRVPGERGEFRGHLSADSKRIVGQWIQPTRNQPYVTPIQLAELARGVWRGVLTPLADRLSLYILIRREADGSIIAFIRNPDFNYLGRR